MKRVTIETVFHIVSSLAINANKLNCLIKLMLYLSSLLVFMFIVFKRPKLKLDRKSVV